MRVTDEMVREALDSIRFLGWHTMQEPVIRIALERALSHAAGQEATTNPAEIGRKSVGGEAVAPRLEVFSVACDDEPDACGLRLHIEQQSFQISGGPGFDNREHAEWMADQLRHALAKLTPAQPPASAEVGRDAARYQMARGFLSAHCVRNGIRHHDVRHAEYLAQVDEAIDAAMAASSEVKGDPLAPVAVTYDAMGSRPPGTSSR